MEPPSLKDMGVEHKDAALHFCFTMPSQGNKVARMPTMHLCRRRNNEKCKRLIKVQHVHGSVKMNGTTQAEENEERQSEPVKAV
jgi:hypothetical protein